MNEKLAKTVRKKSQSLRSYAPIRGMRSTGRLLAVWHSIDHWALHNIGIVGLHALLQSLVYIPDDY